MCIRSRSDSGYFTDDSDYFKKSSQMSKRIMRCKCAMPGLHRVELNWWIETRTSLTSTGATVQLQNRAIIHTMKRLLNDSHSSLRHKWLNDIGGALWVTYSPSHTTTLRRVSRGRQRKGNQEVETILQL